MRAAALSLAALLYALPAAAQDERVWSFNETEEGVHLQYGLPESDDTPVAFVCQKGSDRAELYLTIEHRIATENPTPEGGWLDADGRPQPWTIDLTLSGMPVEAQAGADEMNGGSTLSFVGPTNHEAYRAMAESGLLQAEAFGEVIAPPPFPEADFRRFLEGCGT